ncbi:RNA 3'-terminal phosphate cyclase [Candidatus Woesearchaeota archaeon]|nr:RNA 3'-terminal phosphate cyclase [Candidatus Woesearchaeota archaeon]
MIFLDGSHGEGGGGLLRTALALSALTGKPFKMVKIRCKRENPGLQQQHLQALLAVAKLVRAEVEGGFIGSEELVFKPASSSFNLYHGKKASLHVNIPTAGSVVLVLQALTPALAFSQGEFSITLKGGTDVPMAPPINFYEHVILGFLKQFNVCKAEVLIKTRGYYPKGHGFVVLKFKSLRQAFNLNLNFTKLEPVTRIVGFSHASMDLKKARVAERQASAAKQFLGKAFPEASVKFFTSYSQGLSTGSGICILGFRKNFAFPTISGSSLGAKGKRSELVGLEAAKQFLQESKGVVDKFFADQLLPFLAFSKARFKTSSITKHLLSNAFVLEKFSDRKVVVNEKENLVIVDGK